MARSEPDCPVDEDDRVWIDNTLQWLRTTLGPQGLTATVILPTDAFFPGPYSGDEDEVRALVRRIAGWIDVDLSRVVAGSARTYDGRPLRQCLPVQAEQLYGHYRTADGRVFVDLDELPASPAWATHLALNPRTYLRRGMRYLDSVEPRAVSL